MQEIASLKRQFTELLSDIGFVREGLRARVIERASSMGTDGVLEATGSEVSLEVTRNTHKISNIFHCQCDFCHHVFVKKKKMIKKDFDRQIANLNEHKIKLYTQQTPTKCAVPKSILSDT